MLAPHLSQNRSSGSVMHECMKGQSPRGMAASCRWGGLCATCCRCVGAHERELPGGYLSLPSEYVEREHMMASAKVSKSPGPGCRSAKQEAFISVPPQSVYVVTGMIRAAAKIELF